MTTVTTVEANAHQNRVMSIRKKFETLCHLDLDLPVVPVGINKQREPKYLFRRSATTLNLSVSRRQNGGSDKENGCTIATSPTTLTNKPTAPAVNGKCSAEAALSRLRKSMRNGNGDQNKSPSKTIASSSPPPALVRQTSDPRRASIKRSPAFRVGETHQKSPLAKSSSLNDCQLTDTLRKALRQPLPAGPPPKKPPRLLASPSEKKPFPRPEEEEVARLCWSKKLASNVVNQLTATTRPRAATAGLLCCNNSANIYDDVAGSCYGETQRLLEDETKKKKNEPIYMEPFQHLKTTTTVVKPQVQQRRFSMESLVDRRRREKVKEEEMDEELAEEASEEDGRSLAGSVHTSCSCPEQHTADKEKLDLHYLVISLVFFKTLLFSHRESYETNSGGGI